MPDSAGSTGTPIPPIPALMGAEELYDMLMGKIELDLTSEVYPTIAEKYKGETLEQKTAREARYAKAIEQYKVALQEYSAQWNGQMHSFKTGANTFVEGEDRQTDLQNLQALESAISNLSV